MLIEGRQHGNTSETCPKRFPTIETLFANLPGATGTCVIAAGAILLSSSEGGCSSGHFIALVLFMVKESPRAPYTIVRRETSDV